MTAPIPILLCADDFGLSPGVSCAIAELLTAGRLSATSCMTRAAHWGETAPLLKPLADQVEIGLHFTLTALPPHPPLGGLMKQAFLGGLNRKDTEAELNGQIDAFEDALGRRPDFLDGHQHVHVLPTVRDAVLNIMTGRLKGAWLRDVWEPLPSLFRNAPSPLKALALNLLGWSLHRQAEKLSIPCNRGFRGAYDLLGSHLAPDRLFPHFLAGARPDLLIMCHPAYVDEALIHGPDPVHEPREAERAYLASDLFLRHLAEAGVALGHIIG